MKIIHLFLIGKKTIIRRLFFKRANNEETKNDWNVKCSAGKFSVNLKNKKDGIVYYREFK